MTFLPVLFIDYVSSQTEHMTVIIVTQNCAESEIVFFFCIFAPKLILISPFFSSSSGF